MASMSLSELYSAVGTALAHGANPDTPILGYDSQDFYEIDGLTDSTGEWQLQISDHTEEVDCDHEWVEQEGEPPVDVCISCGATR